MPALHCCQRFNINKAEKIRYNVLKFMPPNNPAFANIENVSRFT